MITACDKRLTVILCFKDPSGRPVVQSFWTSHQTQGRIELFVSNHVSETTLTVAIFDPEAHDHTNILNSTGQLGGMRLEALLTLLMLVSVGEAGE